MVKKAVSLKYPENADAPYISAKATGWNAERMLEIAKKNEIPVVQDSNLTNVLSMQNTGDIIPEDTYVAIANIFAFIVKIEEKRELK